MKLVASILLATGAVAVAVAPPHYDSPQPPSYYTSAAPPTYSSAVPPSNGSYVSHPSQPPVYGSHPPVYQPPVYPTSVPVSDCAKDCVKAYRACQIAPGANQSLCASNLASCVNYNPFDNSGSFVAPTACSSKAVSTTTEHKTNPVASEYPSHPAPPVYHPGSYPPESHKPAPTHGSYPPKDDKPTTVVPPVYHPNPTHPVKTATETHPVGSFVPSPPAPEQPKGSQTPPAPSADKPAPAAPEAPPANVPAPSKPVGAPSATYSPPPEYTGAAVRAAAGLGAFVMAVVAVAL